jgi:transcription elongation factor S-II
MDLLNNKIANMSIDYNCVSNTESVCEDTKVVCEDTESVCEDNESVCEDTESVCEEPIETEIVLKPLRPLRKPKSKKKKKEMIIPDEVEMRDSVIDIFQFILKNYSAADQLESAIFKYTSERYSSWQKIQFRNTYRAKVRSIKFNLTNKNNLTFINNVINNKISVSSIPFMKSCEIFPELYISIFQKIAEKNIKESVDIKPTVRGLFTCEKCKSNETTYYEMQTRSADEPMTAFVTCVNCENRWKN